MSSSSPSSLVAGEDWFAVPVTGWKAISALQRIALEEPVWEAVVAGQTLLTLRYDPIKNTPKEAQSKALKLLEKANAGNLIETELSGRHHILPLHMNDETAPDLTITAHNLGIAEAELPQWLSQRLYRVTLTGFQPGFAYLEDAGEDTLPDIPRLATPRTSIAAGSFGFRGRQACVYAHNGPGGWPVIGRTDTTLFCPENQKSPALLAIGDSVSFTIVQNRQNNNATDDG